MDGLSRFYPSCPYLKQDTGKIEENLRRKKQQQSLSMYTFTYVTVNLRFSSFITFVSQDFLERKEKTPQDP